MKKLINKPEDFARETVEGIIAAHSDQLKILDGSWHRMVRADAKKKGKVAIATGGGSGHLPVFLGYVGYGLCDGVTIGNVFASPSAEDMYEVDKAIHSGAGILHLYGRYGGDIISVRWTTLRFVRFSSRTMLPLRRRAVRINVAVWQDLSSRTRLPVLRQRRCFRWMRSHVSPRKQ